MQVINPILIAILFVLSTMIFVLLVKAYKHIERLENEKAEAIKRADYHVKQLKKNAGIEGSGFELGEKGVKR